MGTTNTVTLSTNATGDQRLPKPTDPEIRAGFAVFDLIEAINALWVLRTENATADFILRDYEAIALQARKLDELASDLHLSLNKEAAE